MFSLNTLIFKYKSKDGKENKVLDLTRSSIKSLLNIRVNDFCEVTKPFEMRPDLISKTYYGKDDKFDLILKFNGISNPFSIYDGQELLIPDYEEMDNAFSMPQQITEPESNGSYADFIVQGKTTTDNKRLEAMKNKAENKDLLPSNMNNECESNVVIAKDKIILGSCVSNTDPLCEGTTTRARLRQKLIDQKING